MPRTASIELFDLFRFNPPVDIFEDETEGIDGQVVRDNLSIGLCKDLVYYTIFGPYYFLHVFFISIYNRRCCY